VRPEGKDLPELTVPKAPVAVTLTGLPVTRPGQP